MSTKFGSTPSGGALSLQIVDEATVRGSLDPEILVRLQINRCEISLTSGDNYTFGNSVMALQAMLPSDRRKLVESRRSEYTKVNETYRFKKIGAWTIGSIEKPFYSNLPEDDDYNPLLKQTKTRFVKKMEKIINPETGVEEEVEVEV